MAQPLSPVARSFQFLGRVQFTMILLIAGVVAMIVGTLIESSDGFAAAQASVYRTFWFQAYLFLIGVNLIVAVINRIPIQRHQWAFVVTHASIVLLLIGAWISAEYGFEGRLIISEGATEGSIWMDDAELRTRWTDGAERTYPLGRNVGIAGRELEAGSILQPSLRIEEHVPNGELRATLVDAGEAGNPGIEVHLQGMGIHTHEWLLGEHSHFRRKDVGPVEIELLVARSSEFLANRLPERDSAMAHVDLTVIEGRQPVRLQFPKDLGREVEIGDGLRAKAVRYLQRARVGAKGIVDRPVGPLNPAAVVEITRNGRREVHTVFSEFPSFNIVEGRDKKSPLVHKVGLTAVTVSTKPVVSVIVEANTGKFWVQLSASIGRGEGLLFSPGQTVGVGNLGLDLKVLKYLPHARPKIEVVPAAKKDAGDPWMRLTASFAGATATEWVRYRSAQTLSLGDRRLTVGWQQQRFALPFRVALDDFEIDFHKGSRRPAQYRSKVRILGAGSEDFATEVSMNRPLDHAGFRVFQSSYRVNPGKPDQSIFTVSRDPGISLVYPSFFLLIFGVGWYLLGSRRPHVPVIPTATGALDPGPGARDLALDPSASASSTAGVS